MSNPQLQIIPWKSQRELYLDSLNYISGRQRGDITSYITPLAKINDAGVDGVEWNSLVILAGRPGSGKTMLKDQIVRHTFDLNPGESIRVLEFQFEMIPRVTGVREFSSVLGKSYKDVCSAGGYKMSPEEIQRCYKYAQGRTENPVDLIENPCTVEQFKAHVRRYMNAKATTVNGKKKYNKTIITADHSYLFLAPSGNKTRMLYDLGEACTELKREFPIIIFMLSQLGRHVEEPKRNENGVYGNYVLETDIFGGDALTQHADMIIGLNRPAKKFIKFYGPERFVIEDDRTHAFHFIKCRNGDIRMSFFKAVYEKMSFEEMEPPGQQVNSLSTNNV